MQLFLSVSPQEMHGALRFTRLLAHAAYRIGPDSTLLRRDLLMDTHGGLLSVSDRDAPEITDAEKLASAVLRECLRRSYGGAVLDFDEAAVPDRTAFARVLSSLLERNRKTLYVPETYAGTGGTVLINSAVSGGSFTARLQAAQTRFGRIALDLQRLSVDFILPAETGEGRSMTPEELKLLISETDPSVFYSQDLCARYFTFQKNGEAHFVLYDDAETLRQKLRIGSTLGIQTAFLVYPEVGSLLPKLFSSRAAAPRSESK